MKHFKLFEEFTSETSIFDELGEIITKLQDKIDAMLEWDFEDPKWINALKGIQSAGNKMEDLMAKATQKLGAIYYNESLLNEAEINSDAEFKEYAMTVLKKAFGEDFDEDKANKVVDGLISKYGDDFGAMVGALQSSMD